MLAQSGYFKDVRDAAQAVAKILAGAEIGLGAVASLMGVFISPQGKITYAANAIAAAIKRSGRYDFRVELLDDKGCTLVFSEHGKEVGKSAFTVQDAKVAGLFEGTNKHNWQRYPRNMLFARALTNGQKWYAPDVGGGIPLYTPEELDVPVTAEGEVLAPPGDPAGVGPADEPAPTLITRPQQKKLFAECRDAGISHEDFKLWLGAVYNLSSTSDLTHRQFEEILTAIAAGAVVGWLEREEEGDTSGWAAGYAWTEAEPENAPPPDLRLGKLAAHHGSEP
jgi:hypothetical protein